MKLKYDLRQSDPEKARAAGNIEQPRPGIYRYQITEVNSGYSKDGNGEVDKGRPRVEVVFSCLDPRYRNSQLWLYIPTPDSSAANEFSTQKLDQLLQVVGFTDGKKNRSGVLDTDKVLKGKTLKVRVRGGSNRNDEYRAEYGSALPDDGDDTSTDDDELTEDEEELTDDEEFDGEDEELEDEELEEDEDQEDAAAQRLAELSEMPVADLKAIAKELDIKLGGKTKTTLIDAIVEAETAEVVEEDEDEELMDEDEEVVEEEEATYLTREDLMAMDRTQLAATAKDFDITPSGMKRSEVVNAILEAQAAPEDDEVPF